jgi:hypothetical protein
MHPIAFSLHKLQHIEIVHAVTLLCRSARNYRQAQSSDAHSAGFVDRETLERKYCRVSAAHKMIKTDLFNNAGEISVSANSYLSCV